MIRSEDVRETNIDEAEMGANFRFATQCMCMCICASCVCPSLSPSLPLSLSPSLPLSLFPSLPLSLSLSASISAFPCLCASAWYNRYPNPCKRSRNKSKRWGGGG